MGSSDKFCLRWNDFETNISAAFQELRDDEDFFDVTLCCGPDGTDRLRAHKVILSACSPFFRGILKNNPHQNPLIYLRGVTMEDLNSLLNFMYHGEANVTQEDLNSFLAVAEDLDVKGLTSSDQEKATKRAGVNPAKFKRTSSGEAASAKKRKVDEAAFEEEPAVVKSEAVTDAFTDDYSLEDTYADEEGGDGDYDRSGGGDLEDFPAEDAPVAGTSGDGAKAFEKRFESPNYTVIEDEQGGTLYLCDGYKYKLSSGGDPGQTLYLKCWNRGCLGSSKIGCDAILLTLMYPHSCAQDFLQGLSEI